MLMRLKTLDVLPVSLGEVKAHLRLEHTREDAYLLALIPRAAGLVEEYLGRSLLTQSWRLIWESKKSYPPALSTVWEDICKVPLPNPPFRALLAVNRLLPEGEKKAIRRHRLDLSPQVPCLIFADVPEPVEIDYETGYGDKPEDIPPLIRQGLLVSIADFYENRESAGFAGLPGKNSLLCDLLATYRVMRLP